MKIEKKISKFFVFGDVDDIDSDDNEPGLNEEEKRIISKQKLIFFQKI